MRTYPLVLLVPLLSERDDPARGHSAPAVDPAHTLVSHIPCSKAQTGFEHGRITSTDVVGDTTFSRERIPWSRRETYWLVPTGEDPDRNMTP